jgi:hypothetical protein
LIGLICLLVIGNPMVRASEQQFGLAAARDTVKTLRAERAALHTQLSELESRKQEMTKSLEAMQEELKALTDKIGRMPKQIQELTFELGVPEGGMQPFDFVLSRHASYLDVEKVTGPERQLWKRPRVLRVWSRSLANAVTTAEKRYPEQNGFIIRVAERVNVGGHPAAQG